MIEAPVRSARSKALAPYVGLVPFSDQDAEWFFGRERERQMITSNLVASRLTLLYGESGVGKTSVLQAGVVHHLRGRARQQMDQDGRPRFVVVEFSAWQGDPMPALLEAIRHSVKTVYQSRPDRMPALPPAALRGDRTVALDETLARWAEVVGTSFLLIMDQFEEYFLYHAQEDGPGTFAEEFPRALRRPDLRANFLVSIREDAYAKLDRFKGRIDHLYDSYLRIGHLNQEAGRAAIEGPIDRYNERGASDGKLVQIERDLIDAVLSQVERGKLQVGQTGQGVVASGNGEPSEAAGIEAPYLQLVMSRLWDEEMDSGSRVLRRETLTRLGEALGIVETHLDKAMGDLSEEERDVAARVFPYLVTPDGTKIAHTVRTLSSPDYAGEDEQRLTPLLEKLSRSDTRILRAVAPPPGEEESRYEVFHDVLAAPVLDWRARREEARRRAESEKRLAEEKREAEEHARQARRKARRAGVLALAAVGFAGAVSVLFLWAVQQNKTARSQEIAANARAVLALDPQRSLRLALGALREKRTPQAEEALRLALPENRLVAAFAGHTDLVRTGAFSPGGDMVVTASWDKTARIWDPRTGKQIRILEGNTEALTGASFNSDGSRVLTTGEDRKARVYDVETGELAFSPLEGHVDQILVGMFSPDDSLILTAGRDGRANLWHGANGARVRRLQGHTDDINGAAFSPDGKHAVTASADGTMRLWNTATGRSQILDALGDGGWVYDAAFSPDGGLVASARSDGASYVWNTANGELEGTFCCQQEYVAAVAFSADGKFLATAGDKVARLYDVEAETLEATMLGHTDLISDVAFSPDGRTLVTASSDGTARLWEANVGRQLAILRGHTGGLMDAAFSPDGKMVVTTSEDNTARVWDPKSGTQLRGHKYWVVDADFSPDGRRVVTAGHDGWVRAWDAETGEETDQFRGEKRMNSVAYAPDGNLVAAASDDGFVYLWEPGSGVDPHMCCWDQAGALSVAFSPDGDRLLVVYWDWTARTWDLATEEEVGDRLEEGQPTRAEYSLDGKRIVTVSRLDKTARIWDAESDTVIHVLRGHLGRLNDAAFSPDGRWVVTGSSDRTARIWNAQSGRLRVTLLGSTGDVTSVAFSPDGARVVGGGEDGTTRVWEAATGRVLAVLHMHADYVNVAVFSPDGRLILTGSDDYTAKLYPCQTCAPLDRLVDVARRTLRIEAA